MEGSSIQFFTPERSLSRRKHIMLIDRKSETQREPKGRRYLAFRKHGLPK